MVFRIYVIILCIGIVGLLLQFIFKCENKESPSNILLKILQVFEKLNNIYIILNILYSVFMLTYSIYTEHWLLGIIPSSFLIMIVNLFLSKKIKRFNFVAEDIFLINLVIWLGTSMLFSVLGFGYKFSNIKQEVEYMNTIEILQYKQVPYTNTNGTIHYIKSTPSNAYYYEVSTDNGGTTTKVIDGFQNYVEKNENNKYAKNPHIDVYKVNETYLDLYGFKFSETIRYNYYIYIPENSIFFEE